MTADSVARRSERDQAPGPSFAVLIVTPAIERSAAVGRLLTWIAG